MCTFTAFPMCYYTITLITYDSHDLLYDPGNCAFYPVICSKNGQIIVACKMEADCESTEYKGPSDKTTLKYLIH